VTNHLAFAAENSFINNSCWHSAFRAVYAVSVGAGFDAGGDFGIRASVTGY